MRLVLVTPERSPKRRVRVIAAALLFAAAATYACAEGKERVDDEGDIQQTDTVVSDTQPIADSSLHDTQTVPDTAQACSPNAKSCKDATTLQTCNPAGTAWVETPCTHGCEGNACASPEPVCTPGTSRCAEYNVVATCSSDGLSEATQPCGAGRCLDDHCGTGKATGEPCAADSECGGGTCLCAGGSCPGTALATGYCTTSACNVRGCAPNEVCANLTPGSGDQQVCIKDCGACGAAGFDCRNVPTGVGAGLTWTEACFAASGYGDVGAACAGDDDCIAGLCLRTAPSGGLIDGGYCSARCTTQSGCPAAAACVKVDGFLGDGGFCALSCVATGGVRECPAERPSTFDIDCFLRAPYDGGAAVSVCFQQ